MWPDFPQQNNFFSWFFNNFETDNTLYLDKKQTKFILIEGVYKPPSSNFRSRLFSIIDKIITSYLHKKSFFKVKIITEAIDSTNFHNFDVILSFDKSNDNSNVLYFPLWFLLPGIFNKRVPQSMENRLGNYPSVEFYNQKREGLDLDDFNARKTIIGFIKNLTDERQIEMSYLSSIFNFQNMSSNSLQHSINKKLNYKNIAKFIYCPENSNYPGYVTEKLFEAYACGSVPVWRGSLNPPYLNEKSYINLNYFKTFSEFINFFDKIQNDINLYNEYFCQPLLHSKPDIIVVEKFIYSRLSNKLSYGINNYDSDK